MVFIKGLILSIIERTDTTLRVDFHTCLLVNAWKKQHCSDKEIEILGEIDMGSDCEIAETFGTTIGLPNTTAEGDPVCELRFRKIKVEMVSDK